MSDVGHDSDERSQVITENKCWQLGVGAKCSERTCFTEIIWSPWQQECCVSRGQISDSRCWWSGHSMGRNQCHCITAARISFFLWSSLEAICNWQVNEWFYSLLEKKKKKSPQYTAHGFHRCHLELSLNLVLALSFYKLYFFSHVFPYFSQLSMVILLLSRSPIH